MNYYELSNKSNITQDLSDFSFSQTGKWFNYFNFQVKQIPQDLLNKDPFFVWLTERYKYIAGVLKLEPYVCYDWHKDTRRGVGLNMLITPNINSYCLFAANRDTVVFKVDELQYKPNTYYLFNTQVDHTVYNFESTRFLLSIEFELDKDNLTFDQLLKDIKDNYEKDCKK
jgi:hypothetical protein